ncbi:MULTISPECIES: sodium-translocating pyrophosphatase [Leeuwenhoekiella]|jgi:K(+)-stimulated pyrophosphate-energized sodium pump|uniref:sodium-translocating pyrophosphatase n=1 Tax=Leeuwenhoekiella TaxID=283735 RepID=UPI000C4B92E9|nr:MULTISPECIES: sodium-translocating pyrophosphatase [Leeuwenhoekiella]MAO42543.1 sodium-translocating pyrophosphatase [Leeuwenhoekiella sp.]HBT08868.1 sodium-translocating pyrophosphatase [Leeuwenhoekiella sp.]HCW63899.1 sodium-translocating pyrophosphatase [Leeuwenhoekiella sp.]|tara:strand:- start:73268 stop:75658 length:2391 start_codon:yes stop_codon:yes gene_type:complete
MESNIIYVPIVLAVLGLLFMFIKMAWVKKQPAGNDKMQSISKSIKEGALAFLAAEYRLLLVFVVIASVLLYVISNVVATTSWLIVPAFIIGAFFSALAGNIGMRIATDANARTAEAAKTSLPNALKVSFGGGTVMGLGVAGLAVLGLSLIFLFLMGSFLTEGGNFYNEMTIVLETLAGFSLGAESIALFARVGGGIYTKAADVGADLVGKVEAGIPEDDPRNPATIADNVGDNVGDVAGMGADLFGSYVATVLAAMVLGNYLVQDMSQGAQFTDAFNNMGPILLPVVIAGVGILASIIGTFLVSIKNNEAKESQVQKALDMGNWVAIILTLIASYFLIDWMLPEVMSMQFFGEGYKDIASINVFWSACIGLAVGALISVVTAHYTSLGKGPVLDIVKNSSTGAATNIIAGLAVGMKSTFLSVLLFAAAIYGSYELAGFYGVALAASAMMATTAMQLAIDAFGPIADNAGGVAEMSELEDHVRERTDILDSVGNTTAAVGKGFAIASAALTALALFAAYVTFTGIDGINIFKADVLAALFVGGMIPVIFSALAMQSVGKAAMQMVQEVRRQFKEIPGILEGTGKPEYGKCVAISTQAALREMILPGLITIIVPIIIGLLFGAEPLGGYMAGVCVSGVMWAIFQNNAGGAWDNAKKSFEAGVEINGKVEYKGSDAHKAAVTGDTVGDPFKDTSGPSMNILIKLTCLVGLVIAPILGDHSEGLVTNQEIKLEVQMQEESNGLFSALVTETTTVDGKIQVTEKRLEGTEAEVKQELEKYNASENAEEKHVIKEIKFEEKE